MSEHEIPENVSGSEEEQVASAQPAEPIGWNPKPEPIPNAVGGAMTIPLVHVVGPDGIGKVGLDPLVHVVGPDGIGKAEAIPAVLRVPAPVAVDTEDNQAEPAKPEQDPAEKEFTKILDGCRKLLDLAENKSDTTGKELIDMVMLNSAVVFNKLNYGPRNLLDEVDDECISNGVIAASTALMCFMNAAAQKDRSYTLYKSQVKMVVSSIINAMEDKLNKSKLAAGS